MAQGACRSWHKSTARMEHRFTLFYLRQIGHYSLANFLNSVFDATLSERFPSSDRLLTNCLQPSACLYCPSFSFISRTSPKRDNGLSNFFPSPTTTRIIFSGWRYFLATRNTSSRATAAIFPGSFPGIPWDSHNSRASPAGSLPKRYW